MRNLIIAILIIIALLAVALPQTFIISETRIAFIIVVIVMVTIYILLGKREAEATKEREIGMT